MPFLLGKVKVDVALCGAVPRSHHCFMPVLDGTYQTLSDTTSSKLNANCDVTQNKNTSPTLAGVRSKTLPSPSAVSDTTSFVGLAQKFIHSLQPSPSEETQDSPMTRRPSTTTLEPPQWAVAAKASSKLEPVCEALDSHDAVDLTDRPFFRIGRSPTSDILLHHNTSSRRHAMLFHHPNGSCYIVDCGSSHGTYVNGVRVRNSSNGSMVVPHRVRRGSLVRFGGPGAPSFVLKSFALGFSSMVKELKQDNDCDSIFRPPTSSREDLVKQVDARLDTFTAIEGGILKKRSFDDVVELSTEPDAKRQRCVSPTLEQQQQDEPLRLVSPDSPRKSRRVTFYEHPQAIYPALVTPDEGSSDEEEMKTTL